MAPTAQLEAPVQPAPPDPAPSAPEPSRPAGVPGRSGAPEPCARLPKPPLLPEELHLWLLDAHRRGNLARYDFVKGLLLMQDHDLAPALGSPNARQYAKKYFQLSDSAVDEALLLARRIDGLPHTLMSFRDGNICRSAAYQICRVATAFTEKLWLEFAKGKSVKQIAEEVTAAIAAGRQKPRKDAWGLPELRQKMILGSTSRSCAWGTRRRKRGCGSGGSRRAWSRRDGSRRGRSSRS